MSHVAVSFEMSEYTADVDGIGKFITRLHSRDYSLIVTHLQVH
jgi:GDP-D-mannose dehydratase